MAEKHGFSFQRITAIKSQGKGNIMALSAWNPTIWSTGVLYNYRNAHVLRGLTNANYEGEISEYGDTVTILTPDPISVSQYGGTVTYEDPDATAQSLLIDQQPDFAFAVPDINRIQSKTNLIQAYTEEAGYAMADYVDAGLAALYTDATSTTSLTITTDAAGVGAAVREAGRKLSELNVPTQGRWMVLSPLVMESFVEYYGDNRVTAGGDIVQANGWVMNRGGFDIYMSNNLTSVTVTDKCLFGTNAAITFAEQVSPFVEALRLETKYSDGIRGYNLYGQKVVRPDALGLLDVTARV